MAESFSSDNAMRKAAEIHGLKLKKERDTYYRAGTWTATHIITREKLADGPRADVAAFVAGYDPGKERRHILAAIGVVRTLAPMIDWPDVRDDADDEYLWQGVEELRVALANFEPNPFWVHPTPPPKPKDPLFDFGFRFRAEEWRKLHSDVHRLYALDYSPLRAIEDEGERRRAFAEAGRLRFYVDYVLEHRASWHEIDAMEKDIARHEETIASLRSNAGRHPGEDPAKRLAEAEKREAKMAELKLKLDERLGVREEHRYWWPHLRESQDAIKELQDDIVAGYHVEHLTRIREELTKLINLATQTRLLVTDGDLRERERKVREAGKVRGVEQG